MNNVKLVWITPEAEKHIAYCARVSNPVNQDNPNTAKMLQYMVTHKHWSPFEMGSACLEINTTRDIARQILRHRSFSFQEFSQRYQDVSKLPEPEARECRLQDVKNRQSSLPTNDTETKSRWHEMQDVTNHLTAKLYREALEMGVAKEVARALLPEGLTPSRMYMLSLIHI